MRGLLTREIAELSKRLENYARSLRDINTRLLPSNPSLTSQGLHEYFTRVDGPSTVSPSLDIDDIVEFVLAYLKQLCTSIDGTHGARRKIPSNCDFIDGQAAWDADGDDVQTYDHVKSRTADGDIRDTTDSIYNTAASPSHDPAPHMTADNRICWRPLTLCPWMARRSGAKRGRM